MFNNIKYSELIRLWYDDHRKTIKESSAYNYSVIIYNHLLPRFGDYKLKKIKHIDIQNYIFELSDKGLSNKTIKTIIIILTNSLKYAINEKYIKELEKINASAEKINEMNGLYDGLKRLRT